MVPGTRDIKSGTIFAHAGRGLIRKCAAGAAGAAANQPVSSWFPGKRLRVLAAQGVLSLHVTCPRISAHLLVLSFWHLGRAVRRLSAVRIARTDIMLGMRIDLCACYPLHAIFEMRSSSRLR